MAARQSRRQRRTGRTGSRSVEVLEQRRLLSVGAAEYDQIRSLYGSFGLPADMGQVNVIEVMVDQLSVSAIKNAITVAASTAADDLVVLRTSDTQNRISYASASDQILIDVPGSMGSISLVGWGTRPLTLDGMGKTRTLFIGSVDSTTIVNMGGVVITGGEANDGQGGGARQNGGTLRMEHVAITGNHASTRAGGFFQNGDTAQAYLTDLVITGNVADYAGGGGMNQFGGTMVVTNAIIAGNTAGHGGAMAQHWGSTTLINVTITRNTAGYGGGLCPFRQGSAPTLIYLYNCILAGNRSSDGAEGYYYSHAPLQGSHNLIGDGSNQTWLVNGVDGNQVGTTANPIDPQFWDTSSTDPNQWDLHLWLDSPAVDAGDNSRVPAGITTDLDGNLRVWGAAVDLGAYEYGWSETDRAPTDLGLLPSDVAENQPAGTVVGTLWATDPDEGDRAWFALVSGEGDQDNASFEIKGRLLQTTTVFDYEAKNSYSIRVRVTDRGGLWLEKVFMITVADVDSTPTGIFLVPAVVDENQPAGTVVGTLGAVSVDPAGGYVYELVDGPGAEDNALFAIAGTSLKTAASLDYESRGNYSIRVRVSDAAGGWFEKALTVGTRDSNDAPTALQLSNSSLGELRPIGTVVGTLSTEDQDADESFTYTLVEGSGAEDNTKFTIVGDQLEVASSLERSSGSCSVRVRSTDSGGLWVEAVFVITMPALPPEVSLVDTPQIIWTSLGRRSAELRLHLVSHAAPLDLASIDGDELIVTGPAGAVSLSLVSVTAASDGYSAEVTYRLAAPGGRWDQADNGSYSLAVPAGSFRDTAGHQNRAKDLGGMGATLPGPLDVQVKGTPYADILSVTLTNSEYVVQINGIGFVYDASLVRSMVILGYGGNDRITITGESYICQVSAGAGNDTIQGGSGDDLIRGDEDQDVIAGNGGEDTLYGNFGNDSIAGGEGADSIMGALGADTLEGGLGDDRIFGGDQRDWIDGEEGDDYIEGRGKADTIYGGAGNDTILGGAGSDSILGDDGDDRIWVGLHLLFADTVNGGAGNDASDGDANDVLSNVESVLV